MLNVTLPESNNSALLFLLDLKASPAPGGSACSSGAAGCLHVLTAIDAIRPNRASLRFSFSRFTTREDVDYSIEKIVAICGVKEVV